MRALFHLRDRYGQPLGAMPVTNPGVTKAASAIRLSLRLGVVHPIP